MNLKIKKFEQDDWEDYKSIRLEALQTYPNVFLSNFDEEKLLPQSKWQDDLKDDSCAIFGVYDDDKIVGLTAVFTWRGDDTGQTAVLAMSYRNPDYRGSGMGQMFYEARIDWAMHQPSLTKIRVSHREGNEPSRQANQKAGFKFVGKEMITWPDGQEDWEYNYELDLIALRRDRKLTPKTLAT